MRKTDAEIRELIAQMTVEEKASLNSGDSMWKTKVVERLGIEQMWMCDGPHGLRKQENYADDPDINDSLPGVSFPAECAMAAGFDRDAIAKVGTAIGLEAQARDVHMVLGPGVNMKRSPLCGRNFEYFSEDPYLAGELATAYINGLQAEGVGACIKHYMANNQEFERTTGSSEIDERTMHEIYMPAFEMAVKNSKPAGVMASYNKVNGTYATESRDLLVDDLRGKWGFDGCVISDWWAVHNRVPATAAGTDLLMPGTPDTIKTDEEVVAAVKDGTLSEKELDERVFHVLRMVYDLLATHREGIKLDFERGHKAALNAAESSIVLLKNEDDILPLKKGIKVALIGDFADDPRYQGGGSSHVNAAGQTYPRTEIAKFAEVTYAQGYRKAPEPRHLTGVGLNVKVDETRYEPDEGLIAEAIKVAQAADVAVIYAGLPEDMETEGDDRKHMQMPPSQLALIDAVAKVQPNCVVLLQNGSPIEMPWLSEIKGLVELYLGGEAGAEAAAKVIFGDVVPSGRLPETFPLKLEDNPSYGNFATKDKVEYKEGLYIGYRHYESKDIKTLFPFGYGLSYTTFEYSDLKVDGRKVSVKVTNTGKVAGREVVQLYVGVKNCEVDRPVRELRGFDKVSLNPGETKEVTFEVTDRAFEYWDVKSHDFKKAAGSYEVQIGKNAHDIVLSAPIA